MFSIIEKFAPGDRIVDVKPLGSGHIHKTYLVITGSGEDLVLQQLNTNVFRNPSAVINNIRLVTGHIFDKGGVSLTPLAQKNGNMMYINSEGNVWRCFLNIPGKSYDRATNPGMVYEGGKAYGKFLKMLADLDPVSVNETISRFHDLSFRLCQFDESLNNGIDERKKEASREIEILSARRDEMLTIQRLGDEGKIPVRIVHHDTKINNVLFDDNMKGMCVIDLDTVMPGFVHDDFGDAIRTFTNTGEEDDADLSKVSMNIEYYEAFTGGFLEETATMLTPLEKEYLPLSARVMTYMQSLRFLTDHLNGDIYYHINHPGHNLQRTKAQVKLLLSMEEQYDKMIKLMC